MSKMATSKAALEAIRNLPPEEQMEKLLEALVQREDTITALKQKVNDLEAPDDEDEELTNAQIIARFTKSYTQKVNTPSMQVGLSFQKYKFSVRCWEKMVDVPKKAQATLLVNNLPDTDKYGGLKELVVQTLGWPKIQCLDGVDNLLE